jgi:phage terminase small subunit
MARATQGEGPVAPKHLPVRVAAAWIEVVARWGDRAGEITGPALEAYCGQIATLRDAQQRLAEEGAVIADPKGNPIPHPALAIERLAQTEIRTWGRRFDPKPGARSL